MKKKFNVILPMWFNQKIATGKPSKTEEYILFFIWYVILWVVTYNASDFLVWFSTGSHLSFWWNLGLTSIVLRISGIIWYSVFLLNLTIVLGYHSHALFPK